MTASGGRAVVAGLLLPRTKAVALVLGPEGVGLLGLYTAAQEIGAQVADAGLSHSSVRELARHRHDPARAASMRKALFLAVLAVSAIAAATIWITRHQIADALTGATDQAAAFGVIALGVALTILFRWRHSLVAASGQVTALSAALVIGTAIAAAGGALLVWQFGQPGLAWATIAVPAAGLLVLLTIRLPITPPARGPLAAHWVQLVRIGVPLMIIAQMALIAPMAIRIALVHFDGLDQAGQFQAAWTVSAQLLAVLLSAVALDFYPTLAAIGTDRQAMARRLHQQVCLHLTLGGPLLLIIAGIAAPILTLVFTAEFAPAAALLQGLMIGGFARLASAPLETVLTVLGRPRVVVTVSLVSLSILLTGSLAGYRMFGLDAIAWAFVAANLFHLVALAALVRARADLSLGMTNMITLAGLIAIGLLLSIIPQAVWAAPVFTLAHPGPRKWLGGLIQRISHRIGGAGLRPKTAQKSKKTVSPSPCNRITNR